MRGVAYRLLRRQRDMSGRRIHSVALVFEPWCLPYYPSREGRPEDGGAIMVAALGLSARCRVAELVNELHQSCKA